MFYFQHPVISIEYTRRPTHSRSRRVFKQSIRLVNRKKIVVQISQGKSNNRPLSRQRKNTS